MQLVSFVMRIVPATFSLRTDGHTGRQPGRESTDARIVSAWLNSWMLKYGFHCDTLAEAIGVNKAVARPPLFDHQRNY
jgi:hypothetical protein